MPLQASDPASFSLRRVSRRVLRWLRRHYLRTVGRSLLLQILAILTLGIGLVIVIYTHLLMRMQERWDRDFSAATRTIVVLMVENQIARAMLTQSGTHFPLPSIITGESNWPHVWIVGDDRKVIAGTEAEAVGQVWDERLAGRKKVTMARFVNHRECQTCHLDESSFHARILMAPRDPDPAEAYRARQRWALFYGVVMAILILIGVTFTLIRFVNEPLRKLQGLMQDVQQGKLSVKFRAHGNNEITRLARGFNRMIQSLANARASLETAHQRQIQRAERLASVGELASGLAHEIRNPLAGIKTAVEILCEKIRRRDGGDDADLRDVVNEVSAQTERVHRLVDDLLQYARPKPPQTVRCSLRDLVEKCLTLIGPQAEKQGVAVEFACRANDCEVCADPEQIHQAILNIVLNAIQAMPNGGRLGCSMDEDAGNGFVLLHVQDNGQGMTPEAQQRVFSPFYTTKPRGTGLGLSITRGIIERHHGTLVFASKLGAGTAFTIRLPLVGQHGCLGGPECVKPTCPAPSETGGGNLAREDGREIS